MKNNYFNTGKIDQQTFVDAMFTDGGMLEVLNVNYDESDDALLNADETGSVDA